jgi:osmoprotectant transport system substrate-binding protein
MDTPKALVMGLALAFVLSAAPALAADKVVVASKIDTEGALLGNVIALLLEGQGLAVENKIQLGPTRIVRAAIVAGQIDIYPEYTGNAGLFFNIETDPAWKDPARGYEKVKALDLEKNNLIWLAPAPANNTWSIAVRKDLAEKQSLKTLEDLARYVAEGGRFKLAASAEFVESPAALPAFQSAYGFKLRQGQLLTLSGGDTAATIRAAAEQTSGVNAAMAYGTDGALAALGLAVLADTKGAQIVYQPAPVIRGAVLEKHPEIKHALDPVFTSLSLQILQALNAKIAVEGQDAKSVAEEYLAANGFLK